MAISRPVLCNVALVFLLMASVNPLAVADPEDAPSPDATEVTAPVAETSDGDGGAAPTEEAAQEAKRVELDAAAKAGQVRLEMTMGQVLMALGEPLHKEVMPPDAELWHYANGEVAFSALLVAYVSLTERPTEPEPVVSRDEPAPKPRSADILGSRSREIARLTASIEARSAAYAARDRRRYIDGSTKESSYASYLAAWAAKVERIGNLNYPQAAQERGVHGSLILHAAVRADGSVESVRVLRSSGEPLLDEAAIRIVELAAPYSPFPPDMAAETNVLDIVRTWQFQRGGKLGW